MGIDEPGAQGKKKRTRRERAKIQQISVRLTRELHQRMSQALEKIDSQSKMGLAKTSQNTLVIRAIEEYLDKHFPEPESTAHNAH